jgi:hypothetical protein
MKLVKRNEAGFLMFYKIMKKLLTVSFTFLLLSSKAQHCPYDGVALIVLNVHSDTTGIIPGLKIYLQDSLGKAVTGYRYINKKSVYDTLWFWQNPARTTFTGYIDNNNPAENNRIRFPFAGDNYVATVYNEFPLSKCKIVITDPQGTFRRKISVLTENDVYPLCSTYNDEVYDCPFKKILYSPANIILEKKN